MTSLSYWEKSTWFANIDFTIVGSGIVGLNCALYLKQKHPKARVLVIDKGTLPQGASTKNAGFACFGSLSELIADLRTHTETEVFNLVEQRYKGLQLLRNMLGDTAIKYKGFGGYELFFESQQEVYNTCMAQKERVNHLLKPLFNAPVFSIKPNDFQFKTIKGKTIFNPFEGQLDTGQLMKALIQKCQKLGITIVNGTTVNGFEDNYDKVTIQTISHSFKSKYLFIATNGFAKQLLNLDVQPARAQVIITKPIRNLQIKGTFHCNEGYYYFRNINNRILLGGGRELDFKTETTTQFGTTSTIQNKLKHLLHTCVLPNTTFDVDYSWSGIMGVSQQKQPIIKPISKHVYCGVKLGGMGIAIGALMGNELANFLD